MRELVEQALDELGAQRPTVHAACYVVARAHARRIVAGEVAPQAGARTICDEAVRAVLDLGDQGLSGFLYWEDEWCEAGSPERSAFCEHAIVEVAKDLLAKPPPPSRV